MNLLVLDFETYYDRDYSLSKMTYEEYTHDPRFAVQMMGYKLNNEPTKCAPPHLIPSVLNSIDWANTLVVAHNMVFDGYILGMHYKIPSPQMWGDTWSMAQFIYGSTFKKSLAALATHFGLPPKGNATVMSLGKRTFTQAEYNELAEYCIHDVDLCYEIFIRMASMIPASEKHIISHTLRMFCEPKLELDATMLQVYKNQVISEKETLLQNAGLSERDALMSNAQFATLLENLGVEVPLKVSTSTGKTTYALAKTDPGFKALLEHENPLVSTLANARIGVKSTLAESRADRFLFTAMAKRPWAVFLTYCGADTGRFSGGNKQNPQNLPRGGTLRRAIMAPPGHQLVVVDSSQIEVRMNATVANEPELLRGFANKEDIYSEFASSIYGRKIDRKRREVIDGVTTYPDQLEGHVGKTAVLGLGYGMGAEKFQTTLKAGNPSVEIELEMAKYIVKTYRTKYFNIAALWRTLERAIQNVYEGERVDYGMFSTSPEGLILNPNGYVIRYDKLRREDNGWVYFKRGKPVRLYGAKAVENVIQGLARIAVTDQLLLLMRPEVQAYFNNSLVLFAHDELVFTVPDEKAQEFLKFAVDTMHVPPAWAPHMPIAAEGDLAVRYGDAK